MKISGVHACISLTHAALAEQSLVGPQRRDGEVGDDLVQGGITVAVKSLSADIHLNVLNNSYDRMYL